MLSVVQAAILGVVEGLTEFLPISSTAHLILTADLLRIVQSDYTKSFEIVIQLGAILAVVGIYWKRFLDWRLLTKLFVAFLPTGILGLAFYHLVKTYLIGNTAVTLWALAIGGVLLIVIERFFARRATARLGEARPVHDLREIGYGRCLALGVFQAIAMVPGVSRSGATIIGGMFMGIDRKTIVEFSFLLAAPTMAAATGLDLISDRSALAATGHWLPFAIGLVAAFVTAIIAIRWLLRYVQNHSFTAFGIYRILLVLAFLAFYGRHF